MLWNLERVRGYALAATDGTLGVIADELFDDTLWTVRYVVVDAGAWLAGRLVLIAPAAFGPPDEGLREIPVALSKEEIRNSPDIQADQSVSRHLAELINTYYGWPLSAAAPPVGLVGRETGLESGTKGEDAMRRLEEDEKHLRSAREVESYAIAAVDGDIGHLEDLLIDDDGWIIRYLVVDTRDWLPGRRVLVAPRWVRGIDWRDGRVHVDQTREVIRHSPPYDPAARIDRGFEEKLHVHYRQTPYWRE